MSNQKKIVGFIALTIAMFMGTLDTTIVNIALPDIIDYFHSNLNDTSWITTIYVMSLAVFTIPASKLADQFGRKKVMLLGLVLFGATSALCGFSHSLLFLIAMRLLQGIGGAILTPLVIPMGLALFRKEKMQVIAAAIGGVTALAAAGGPPIGGILIKYIDWQSIFFVNVPFALIAVVLVALFIDESYDKTVSKSIDWAGMVLLMTTLFLLTFALLKGNDYGWKSTLIVSMFAGSALALGLFIFTEIKVKAPMVEFPLFREVTFTASSMTYLINGFGISSPIIIFNYFLQDVLGYQPLNAAFIIMATSLTVIVSMPLGSIIAGKVGARPVNFLGLLFMAAGTFLLSRLQVDTSKPAMIADMAVCGFGLGFATQSMISAVKHLPTEKSGIGSGIVNAARQVGTCIGIALLVSVLDADVASAKDNIVQDANSTVHNSQIAAPVRAVMVKDIDQSVDSGGDNDSHATQRGLQRKLSQDIQTEMNALSSTPAPKDGTLTKLYDGANSISKGSRSVVKGQGTLTNGLVSLSSGLNKLSAGSRSLTSGLNTLHGGLSQAYVGAQALNSAGSEGLSKFASGVRQLNNGAQTLLQQFSSSNNPNNPTVYDGVTGMSKGAKSLSSNLNQYVSAVNETYYLMIKNDPAAPQLLQVYKNNLSQAESAYATAKGNGKIQAGQQVQALANLVALYTAGTNPSVSDENQFQSELENLARQNAMSQNVVSSGNQVTMGASQLSTASQQVAGEFGNGGKFKNDVEQLAQGTAQLNRNSGKLSSLGQDIGKLTTALGQLSNGSTKLSTASQAIQSGVASAQKGSRALTAASRKLKQGDVKIQTGTAQLASGVSLAGQKDEIQEVTNKIKSDTNTQLAHAFDRNFAIAAVILAAASVFGLFTDKRRKKDANSVR